METKTLMELTVAEALTIDSITTKLCRYYEGRSRMLPSTAERLEQILINICGADSHTMSDEMLIGTMDIANAIRFQ